MWIWLQLIRRSQWIALGLILAATAYTVTVAPGGRLLLLYGLSAYGIAAALAVALPQLAWKAILRRHADAFEREDAAALWALARRLEPYSSDARLRGLAGSIQLSAMMADERHGEVRARCGAALGRPMSAGHRAILGNALAWATAHDGDAAAAVPIAEAAVDGGGALPENQRALCIGTLGIALVLAGRPTDAIVQIEKALGMGGTPRAQAIRSYYLGEALRALGSAAEARAAYVRCIRECPTSKWATRAAAARDTLGVAYR